MAERPLNRAERRASGRRQAALRRQLDKLTAPLNEMQSFLGVEDPPPPLSDEEIAALHDELEAGLSPEAQRIFRRVMGRRD